MKLSVALITFNEGEILAKTLAAVEAIADEIVIVDSGSTDETEHIAKKFNAHFIQHPWSGYGAQKNYAIKQCAHPWILNIDADEELSPELIEEIRTLKTSSPNNCMYAIKFISVCFGKQIKYGGWSNFYKIRLFKKDAGKYNEASVHEKFISSAPIVQLNNPIYHHSYVNLADYFTKFNRYTSEGAYIYYQQGKQANTFKIVLAPIFKFIKMYVIKLGFLDGIEGFILAKTSALYTMTKYYKLKELHQKDKS